MSYLRDSCCCICTKRLDKEKKPNIRKISHNNINNYRRAFPNYAIDLNNYVCCSCKNRFYNIRKSFENEGEDQNESQTNSNESEAVLGLEYSLSHEFENGPLGDETDSNQDQNVLISNVPSVNNNLISANCGNKFLEKTVFFIKNCLYQYIFLYRNQK